MSPLDTRRLYKSVNKLMLYWFARLMLGMDNSHSQAFKSGISVDEFKAIRTHSRKRRYWQLRDSGLSSYEVRAIIDGTTPEIVRSRSNSANRRQAERLGGYPKAGTQAYTRWLIAR